MLAYLILLIVMSLRESQMVYPGAYFAEKPPAASAESPYEQFEYASPGGEALTGYLLDRKTSNRWVVFFHGNATRADQMFGLMERFADAFQANVACIEYRGYTNDVTPGESGVIADAISGTRTLMRERGVASEDLVLYGRSLGGAVAAAVAVDVQPAALVMERTFDSAVRVAATKFPWVPVRWLMKNRFDSSARLTTFDGILVVAHGRNDEIVPFDSGKRLFESADTERKHWIELENWGHMEPIGDATLNEIVSSIARLQESTTAVTTATTEPGPNESIQATSSPGNDR